MATHDPKDNPKDTPAIDSASGATVKHPADAPSPLKPATGPERYYDVPLTEIPKRRYPTDRLYRIGKTFRVTKGTTIDHEVELEWPAESI